MALWLALNQDPIHLEFIVAGLSGSKAPLIGNLDLLKDIYAAGITVALGDRHSESPVGLGVTSPYFLWTVMLLNARKNIVSGGEGGI